MNYDQPRRLDTGGWHYTSMNDGRVHAIGACRDHLDAPHATEDEARACYREYERTRIKLDSKWSDWSGCEYRKCDVPTKTAATAGEWGMASLCAEHLTIECAIEALGLDGPLAGDSVHS